MNMWQLLFNTPLSPDEEKNYQTWRDFNSMLMGRDLTQDENNYDLRGLWKENGGFGPNGHAPDTFKKPNHPTFSDESKYSTDLFPGGKWDTENGRDTFAPSIFNLIMTDPETMKRYFAQVEPMAKLIMANHP